MLVLTRKEGESIIIGSGPEAVEIIFLGYSRQRARIGIKAPRDVPVRRNEVPPEDEVAPAKTDG